MKEPVRSGPYKGFKADREGYERMLGELYALWDWDPATGLQTRAGLERVGLGHIADRLARIGMLAVE